MTTEATDEIVEFLTRVTTAMGLSATTTIEATETGPRINIGGEGAELLLWHRGEALRALQHMVDMVFGRQLADDERVFLDCLEYRKGKDLELKQMARFLAQKAKDTGLDQELGPLNPYERRLVHMSAAEVPGVTTESVGDAHLKKVIISGK
ncbi:MAG: hypothetical protein KGN76_18635 [Acidobacteriota bacterium]|nr:hypothetical protein [Acidobacteriota bacterium]